MQATIITMVRQALEEDIGSGDISAALVSATAIAQAQVVSREAAVLCGGTWFTEVFRQLDPTVQIVWHAQDGEAVQAEQILCALSGKARTLLSGERTALNFLQTLSGTATLTRQYVEALRGTRTKLLDTRKTIPGWRLAQKYAVRCGGGHNHRLGLYDAFLIKENHIMACGSIANAVLTARELYPLRPIEIEVENLAELEQALAAGVERVLLDNFDLALMRAAVELTAGCAELEVSGNVNLTSLRQIADTGVDYISSGALTKHVQAVDLSMRFFS